MSKISSVLPIAQERWKRDQETLDIANQIQAIRIAFDGHGLSTGQIMAMMGHKGQWPPINAPEFAPLETYAWTPLKYPLILQRYEGLRRTGYRSRYEQN